MKITQEKLKEIIASHGKWLRYENGGERADLNGANLSGADLSGANLCGADLFPDWMLAQMERDLEWNFELMEMRRDGDGKVKFDDDCEFQRPFLEAVKEQRRKLKEDNKCQQ